MRFWALLMIVKDRNHCRYIFTFSNNILMKNRTFRKFLSNRDFFKITASVSENKSLELPLSAKTTLFKL